ncbi:MAG: prepilin peptidase [Pseudomonadota bacterium]
MTLYALYVMAAILLAAVLLELKTGKIPNWLTLLPFLLFAVVAVMAEDRSAVIWPLVQAAVVFGIGLLLFAFAGFGAGAVKLMTGLALFVQADERLWSLGAFVVALFVTALIIVPVRKRLGSDDSTWHVMAKPVLPMSVPIALAGWAAIFIFPL